MKNQAIHNISFGTLLFLTVLFMTPASVYAQVSASSYSYQPMINQYEKNDAATGKASWWNLLGRQLTYSIDKPYDQVSDSELKDIIFFASNHKDKVKLQDALPSLLSVFKHNEDEQIRIMAVSAIHAIGNRGALIELKKAADLETSPRVQRIAYAAVNNYFTIK